jgi:hypothetical protein
MTIMATVNEGGVDFERACALCLGTASVELLELDHQLVALRRGSVGIRLLNARVVDNGRAVVCIQRGDDIFHLCGEVSMHSYGICTRDDGRNSAYPSVHAEATTLKSRNSKIRYRVEQVYRLCGTSS